MIILKGLLIGFLMALPVGPTGAISARRALTQGYRSSLLSGIGASVADVVYLIILEFGESRFRLSFSSVWIRAIGGLLIVYVGATQLFTSRNATWHFKEPNRSDLGIFGTSLFMSLANPTILVSLAVMLETFEVSDLVATGYSAALLTVSVFCGSAILWLILARLLSNQRFLPIAYRAAGIFFISLGTGIVWIALSK